jgi:chromosome segregation ATPase
MSDDMRREIDDLKARTVRYEADARALFESVESMTKMLRRVVVTTTQTGADLAELKTYVREKLVTKNEFDRRMDGFAGRIDDFRLHMAQQKERLDDLESKSKDS